MPIGSLSSTLNATIGEFPSYAFLHEIVAYIFFQIQHYWEINIRKNILLCHKYDSGISISILSVKFILYSLFLDL